MVKLQYNLSEIPDFVSVAPGRYRARVKSVVKAPSKSSGKPTLTWTWQLLTGLQKGQTIKSWTSLSDDALFGMKQHLMAIGFTKKVNVNTDDLIGKVAVLVVGEREGISNGKKSMFSNVIGLLPKNTPLRDEDEAEEDEDDDRPAKKRKSSRNSVDDEDDEDDEDEDEDDEDERPTKKSSKSRPIAKKKRRVVEDEDDEDEDDDDVPF